MCLWTSYPICKIRPTLSLKQRGSMSGRFICWVLTTSTSAQPQVEQGKGQFRYLLLRAADETQLYCSSWSANHCKVASCCVSIACLWCTAVKAATFAPRYFPLHQFDGDLEQRPILQIVIASLRHYSKFPSLRTWVTRFRASIQLRDAARLLVESIGAQLMT